MSRRSRRARQANRVARDRRLESLEARVVMSANPLTGPLLTTHGALDDAPALTTHGVPPLTTHTPMLGGSIVESAPARDPNADFWIDSGTVFETDDFDRRVQQSLYDAHGLTGQDEVVDTYGFDGSGQTVVVIDSGIAWSHTALGGGLGEGYRVVGGWDFTENDADPYDDGPGGRSAAHGTHVAGIIGASGDGAHQGVATGVDLVGLRVFDDAGNGYFSWVEQALDWVYTNRNAFENDITAVNLSLGTSWNSDSNPSWAMLEDEFAALEAEGIFISVSAGNDFTTYNEQGVSYPASSDHVIPVMSVDNNGSLSYFSQRATYAIGAPGRWITSTVPDYAANDGDTIDDDWLSMSGTSMAAPYVAGASVLVREAMEFVGQTGIDQWDLYNHMMSTADSFFDSATNATYKRLNLQAAIDALMPTDDYGGDAATAHSLGMLQDSPASGPLAQSTSVSGVISTLTDADHFTFIAGATGTVTISAENVTHDLVASWEAWGGSWSVTESGDCVIDVVAGQVYRVGLSSAGGLGYYSLSVSLDADFLPIQSGSVGPQETRTGLSVTGERWYAFTAGATGYFTVESLPQQGSASVAVYDAQQSLLASDNGSGRADAQVSQGDTVLVRVTGDSSDLNLRLTNAVSQSGDAVTLTGTDGDDALEFTAGSAEHTVSLNGVMYTFASGSVANVAIDGGGGSDSVIGHGSDAIDQAELSRDLSVLDSLEYRFSVTGVVSTTFVGSGEDVALLTDTELDEVFVGRENASLFRGAAHEYQIRVNGYGVTNASAVNGGYDRAALYDSAGDDLFIGRGDNSILRATDSSYRVAAREFERVNVYSSGSGHDRAFLFDTPSDDLFVSTGDYAVMFHGNYDQYRFVQSFDYVWGDSSNGGLDRALLYDTVHDDQYIATPDYAAMITDATGVVSLAVGFSSTRGFGGSGGNDTATFEGSTQNDIAVLWRGGAAVADQSLSFDNSAEGFDSVRVRATQGGADQVTIRGSDADDRFEAYGDTAEMEADGDRWSAIGFDEVRYDLSSGGADSVSVGAIDYALTQLG